MTAIKEVISCLKSLNVLGGGLRRNTVPFMTIKKSFQICKFLKLLPVRACGTCGTTFKNKFVTAILSMFRIRIQLFHRIRFGNPDRIQAGQNCPPRIQDKEKNEGISCSKSQNVLLRSLRRYTVYVRSEKLPNL